MENSVLKNQWYLVNKDGEPYLYVSVKKDFFAEAVRISDGTLLVGYFDYYESLNLFILNENEMVEDGRYVGAIAIAPSVSGKYDISGSITSSNYKLYEVRDMDEDCYVQLHPYFATVINENMDIVHITDKEKISDINYYIRQSRNVLSNMMKESYNYQQRNRYGKLKESLKEMRWDIADELIPDKRDDNVSWDDIIEDLKRYLKTLQPDLDYMDDELPSKKERWRNNKDKVKKKSKKKKK